MRHLKTLVIALGLAAAACKGDSAKRANDSARKVVDRTADLVQTQTDRAKTAADDLHGVAKRASRVSSAEIEFEARRDTRLAVLKAQGQILSLQPIVVTQLASVTPLTDAGRADVNAKIEDLMMRVDEANNAIVALEATDAVGFTAQDDLATSAMSRLVTARDAAFKALDDAPRADRSS